jgi:hypothetical protein
MALCNGTDARLFEYPENLQVSGRQCIDKKWTLHLFILNLAPNSSFLG